jgi:hypothetical protein
VSCTWTPVALHLCQPRAAAGPSHDHGGSGSRLNQRRRFQVTTLQPTVIISTDLDNHPSPSTDGAVLRLGVIRVAQIAGRCHCRTRPADLLPDRARSAEAGKDVVAVVDAANEFVHSEPLCDLANVMVISATRANPRARRVDVLGWIASIRVASLSSSLGIRTTQPRIGRAGRQAVWERTGATQFAPKLLLLLLMPSLRPSLSPSSLSVEQTSRFPSRTWSTSSISMGTSRRLFLPRCTALACNRWTVPSFNTPFSAWRHPTSQRSTHP